MAVVSLWANKLRSLLSLVGISIGIFCIILVWTFVDSMEANINSSFESMGQNVVYVQKWPWDFSNDYPWWKYMNRPRASLREAEVLKERLAENESVVAVDFMFRIFGKNLKAGSNSVEQVSGLAIGHRYDQINPVDIESGRYFSENESRLGNPAIILGTNLAFNLFGTDDPIGKSIQVFGKKVYVIGVLKKKGKSLLGNSEDDSFLVPVNFYRKTASLARGGEPSILVKGQQNVEDTELEMIIKGAMRSIRRLGPRADDDFALNRVTMLTQIVSSIFKVLHSGGGIIGAFSMLVGGFGIANIMFVSVKERTPIIGIQKALGATKYFILAQFLTESVLLSLIGGLIGVAFVFFSTYIISSTMEIEIQLSATNFILSNVLSAGIGLLAGMIPALSAAKMDPVEAMRAK